MTHKTLSAIIFLMSFTFASLAVKAAGHANKTETSSKAVKSQSSEHQENGKKMPVHSDSPSKAPHGKVHAPHMEELPHIHKFHKERVKKIKKHHGKFWLLSQVIIVLCHLSILVIGYLHAAH